MEFRTELKLKKNSKFNLGYKNHILLIGSCFSENIGNILKNSQFPTLINPFGTLYNSHSILKNLLRASNNDLVQENELVKTGNLFCHLDFHSSFNSISKEDTVNKINKSLIDTNKFLIQENLIIIITLGTRFVYKYSKTGEIVANCHKIPNAEFSKELLSIEKVEMDLNSIQSEINSFNGCTKFIFTLSPVRHIKDGIQENALSKSGLLVAINNSLAKYSTYFPSYEILLDDLRDYRFYKDDLIHPSDKAIDYIWSKFCDEFLSFQDITASKESIKILEFSNHRLFDNSITNINEKHKKLTTLILDWEKKFNTKWML